MSKSTLIKIYILLCILFLMNTGTFAQQNVGIGITTPDNSAMLDVTSTTKGMLIPRMTTAQRTAILSPATGLLVYDTDFSEFWYFDGTVWVPISGTSGATGPTGPTGANGINGVTGPTGPQGVTGPSGAGNAWLLTGNSATTPGTNFLGTTDTKDMYITTVGLTSPPAFYIQGNTWPKNFGFNTTTQWSAAGGGSTLLNVQARSLEGDAAISLVGQRSHLDGNDNASVDFMETANGPGVGGNNPIAQIINYLEGYDPTNIGGNLVFKTKPDAGAIAERMRISGAGFVGIGTTFPTEALHVVGNTKISSLAGAGTRMVQADLNGILKPLPPGTVNQVLLGTGVWGSIPSGWSILGNAGTVDGVNFLGTTDNVPLNFRMDNFKAGRIEGPPNFNTFYGYRAGENNATFQNSAFGAAALVSNTTGEVNTACGYLALYSNTVGMQNTGLGDQALYQNLNGGNNTSVGYASLLNNISGSNNTAVGQRALWTNTSGKSNTAIGINAFYFDAADTNSTALGANTLITASNQVRIGTAAVTSIGGFVAWTNLSDSRFKRDVSENIPGLSFITKLRPVTYHLDMEKINAFLGIPDSMRDKISEAKKGKILQTGFIAQEVEKAANELGFDFSGVDKPKNERDYYGLRYAEFTVPLVKAVQELNDLNLAQKKMIDAQQREINDLKTRLNKLEMNINKH